MGAIASAIFAGIAAVGVTVAIERWGGRVGGLVGTLPSTIVPAAVGIYGASHDVEAFRTAMYATPLGMLLNAAFLFVWIVAPAWLPTGRPGTRLVVITVASLLTWTALAATLVVVLPRSESALVVGIAATVSLLGAGLFAMRRAPASPGGSRGVKPATLVARGVLAAAAIGASVVIARTGGSVAAGLAAVFPAIFLTTMVSLWLSQGEAVPTGAAGPMMLGSTSVASYALLAAWLFPWLGTAFGAVIAWLIAALGVSFPLWLWLRRGPPRPQEPGGDREPPVRAPGRRLG